MEAIECGKVSLKELSGYAQCSMEIASPWNQQSNSFDCGVFCAVGCECVALGIPMMMQQDRAEFFRRKMAADIINQSLT
jgi:Ulp1 family protease